MQQTIRTTIQYPSTIRELTDKEYFTGHKVMKQNLAVKPDESVLIVTDTTKKDPEASIFYESAKKVTKSVTCIVMDEATENAQEPPSKVFELMKKNDVVLLVTSYSLSHTEAADQARKTGARIASLPGITKEVILRTLSLDYSKISVLSKNIAALLTKGNKAQLTSTNGTEITFDLSGRTAMADTGLLTNPGDFGNLPAGEAFIAPVEGKSEGLIVFDGTFDGIHIDEPIKVTIKHGHAVNIQGGEGARILTQRLSRVGKRGYNVAELGVGTNKMARLDSSLLEVEKVYETVHVALGNNAFIGGEVDVPFHSDGVLLKPTLTVDNSIIIQNGQFQI